MVEKDKILNPKHKIRNIFQIPHVEYFGKHIQARTGAAPTLFKMKFEIQMIETRKKQTVDLVSC